MSEKRNVPMILESELWFPSTLSETFRSLMNAERKRMNAFEGRGM